jgi:hypothetical protein
LLPLINVNNFPTDIGIAKPRWLRAYICDLCLSVPTDPIWNIGSLTKINHVCDPKVIVWVKPLAEDKRKALHQSSFRCLADVVNYWIGDTEAYIKAEELLPTESYDFITNDVTSPSDGGYISFGDLNENHWADRAVQATKKSSMATGAVLINKDELVDFLSIAMATFGIFRVKMPDGGTRDFLIYIVRGLESCKFNHCTTPEAKSINTNTSKHTNLHNVIQYVNGGAIFRLDKLDSKSNKNLSLQIQEWSNNHARYLSYAMSGRKDLRR